MNKQPEIRFNSFNDGWKSFILAEILKVNSGRDYKKLNEGNIPVYGTGGYMLSVDDKLSSRDAIGIGRKGTIDKPQYLKAPFWTVDTLFFLTPLNENNLNFIYQIAHKIKWKKYSEQTGVPSLSKQTIEKISIRIPHQIEQQKIGEFFKQLDDRIALQQNHVEQLKQSKQGFLQKMFPKDGESVPEVRFDGFSEEWEDMKIGDIATVIGGGTPDTNVNEYWDGDINWFSPAEIGKQRYLKASRKKITELGLEKSSAKLLPVGTVLFTSRAGIGNTAILQVPSSTNQGFQSIIPEKEKLDTYFLYTRTPELKKYGEINGAGSTFIEISGKEMAKMKIKMPSLVEQQKIGKFFKQLDDLIAKNERELELLQETKKGFLQKMFV